eukprot:365696-Chlamydomonas_euryale.AAC.6
MQSVFFAFPKFKAQANSPAAPPYEGMVLMPPLSRTTEGQQEPCMHMPSCRRPHNISSSPRLSPAVAFAHMERFLMPVTIPGLVGASSCGPN